MSVFGQSQARVYDCLFVNYSTAYIQAYTLHDQG